MLTLLEQVRNPECTACPLYKGTVNRCIMGKGDPKAKVMLVGEAPGETEAKTGKPFMGPAGQLLDRVLEELGMIDQVYITNVAKCRPPLNRKPEKGEVAICTRLYLNHEREIVQPKVIVLMGRSPIDRYLDNREWVRGKVVEGKKWNYLPTWHPSWVLRGYDPTGRSQLKAHLKTAREYVS